MIEINKTQKCYVDERCMSCKHKFTFIIKIDDELCEGQIKMLLCGYYECGIEEAQGKFKENCKGFSV